MEVERRIRQEEYMTINEVADLLKVTAAWVRAHANGHRQPTLPSIKIGKHRRFRREAVMQFLARLEGDAAA